MQVEEYTFVDQTSIFETMLPKFKIKNHIRLIELFAGIGAQAKAMQNIGADFERWRVVEFDQNAIKSYNAVHNTNFTTSDIRNIHAKDLDIKDKDNNTYIMFYSFPCQDLSMAGKQRGMTKDSGTRSGLLWEVERILNELKPLDELPQVLIMENVPQVHGTKNLDDFNKWQKALEKLGYRNYWKDLNAKNYGIPQNRVRCFMVSILGNYSYTFPKSMKLNVKLKDLLNDKVDEKYYLSQKRIEAISKWSSYENPLERVNGNNSIVNCLTTVCQTNENGGMKVYSDKLEKTTNVRKFIPIINNTSKGYLEAEDGDGCYISHINKKRGTVQKQMTPTLKTSLDIGVVVKDDYKIINYADSDTFAKGKRVLEDNKIFPTLKTCNNKGVCKISDLRIRKLTPKECWKLMGFSGKDFEKAKTTSSDNQLYKQAGNSIVVNVLEAIFKELIEE